MRPSPQGGGITSPNRDAAADGAAAHLRDPVNGGAADRLRDTNFQPKVRPGILNHSSI